MILAHQLERVKVSGMSYEDLMALVEGLGFKHEVRGWGLPPAPVPAMSYGGPCISGEAVHSLE